MYYMLNLFKHSQSQVKIQLWFLTIPSVQLIPNVPNTSSTSKYLLWVHGNHFQIAWILHFKPINTFPIFKIKIEVFVSLIQEQLSGKTRILVTHSTSFLSKADRIVVMDTEVVANGDKTRVIGKISHIGTYPQLISKGWL